MQRSNETPQGYGTMKEFKCKKCKKPIALTDGKFLYAGGMAFSFKTTGVCLHCGQVNIWRPLLELTIDKPLMFDVLSIGREEING